ncbi:DUF1275 domain-containing protein [Sinomicrobium soli]|nr:DUF1275 domain-containing protein [Sinomicrobium sp. N-1-3-6]
MFRHRGRKRAFAHNRRLASILSFVAGVVNIAGILSLGTLTTNVTGHFAYFSRAFVDRDHHWALLHLLFIFFFLLGAFVSGWLSEMLGRTREKLSYLVPIFIEFVILLAIAVTGTGDDVSYLQGVMACSLLFAMGLQNALVTKISQSVVRTTHLTGLFTDLGIELSQLFFYRRSQHSQWLRRGIYLKLTIIACFFIGGIIGGIGYNYLHLKVLLLACAGLITAIFYDAMLLRFYLIRRKIISN